MQEWAKRDAVDGVLLSVADPAGGLAELEAQATLEATLEALRAETRRAVDWRRHTQLREPEGWADPARFYDRFDDGRTLVNCRVFVEGWGEGTVLRFDKSTFGTSEHFINFSSVVGDAGTAVRPCKFSAAVLRSASQCFEGCSSICPVALGS